MQYIQIKFKIKSMKSKKTKKNKKKTIELQPRTDMSVQHPITELPVSVNSD